jgi:excisionase family DNA binding protein
MHTAATMDDLFTTREVQDLLKLDRTTVYRMLKDGRLGGTRVGQQWRFTRQQVQALLHGTQSATPVAESTPNRWPSGIGAVDALPLHCIQAIQDVFAQLAHVGAVTARLDGQPLTSMSNPCRLYSLMQTHMAGRRHCIATWRALARRSERFPQLTTCPAGLGYLHVRIDVEGQPTAVLVAGPFRLDDEGVDTERLAHAHDLDAAEVAAGAADVPLLAARAREDIAISLQKVAQTFETIGSERARMLGRLQRIAALSMLDDRTGVDDR